MFSIENVCDKLASNLYFQNTPKYDDEVYFMCLQLKMYVISWQIICTYRILPNMMMKSLYIFILKFLLVSNSHLFPECSPIWWNSSFSSVFSFENVCDKLANQLYLQNTPQCEDGIYLYFRFKILVISWQVICTSRILPNVLMEFPFCIFNLRFLW